jgi:methanogenic corrinoid protein MtbC1
VELGDAWARGQVGVAGEHLVAHAVQRRLGAAYEAAARPSDGPRVVIGLPPGAQHDLGALAFATAARRAGLQTAYLGADLPAREWLAAVRAHAARCAVMAAPRAEDLTGLRSVVRLLRRQAPDVLLAVGGAAQDAAPSTCLRLGHDVGEAARALAERLRTEP